MGARRAAPGSSGARHQSRTGVPPVANRAQRAKNRVACHRDLGEYTRRKTSRELLDALEQANVASGPIYKMDEVFADPHVQHLGMVLEATHPQTGPIRMVRNPVTFSEMPVDLRQLPPRLGEHTEEVLGDLLGYSAGEVRDLRAAGVV